PAPTRQAARVAPPKLPVWLDRLSHRPRTTDWRRSPPKGYQGASGLREPSRGLTGRRRGRHRTERSTTAAAVPVPRSTSHLGRAVKEGAPLLIREGLRGAPCKSRWCLDGGCEPVRLVGILRRQNATYALSRASPSTASACALRPSVLGAVHKRLRARNCRPESCPTHRMTAWPSRI